MGSFVIWRSRKANLSETDLVSNFNGLYMCKKIIQPYSKEPSVCIALT